MNILLTDLVDGRRTLLHCVHSQPLCHRNGQVKHGKISLTTFCSLKSTVDGDFPQSNLSELRLNTKKIRFILFGI